MGVACDTFDQWNAVPSGFSGRHADGESGSPSSSSSSSLALGAANRGQAEVTRDPAPLLRGFRKPATGEWLGTRFSAWKGAPGRISEKMVFSTSLSLLFIFTSWVALYFCLYFIFCLSYM